MWKGPASNRPSESNEDARSHADWRDGGAQLFLAYRQRSLVGLALMIAQGFSKQRDLLNLCRWS